MGFFCKPAVTQVYMVHWVALNTWEFRANLKCENNSMILTCLCWPPQCWKQTPAHVKNKNKKWGLNHEALCKTIQSVSVRQWDRRGSLTCPALCRFPKWTSGMKRTGWESRSIMVLSSMLSALLMGEIGPKLPFFPNPDRVWNQHLLPGNCSSSKSRFDLKV